MTIFYSQSLNAYFDSKVTPLDQMPADIIDESSIPEAINAIAEIESNIETSKTFEKKKG